MCVSYLVLWVMRIDDVVVAAASSMTTMMALEVIPVSNDDVRSPMVFEQSRSRPLLDLRADLSCGCSSRLTIFRRGISEYCNPIVDLASVLPPSTGDS